MTTIVKNQAKGKTKTCTKCGAEKSATVECFHRNRAAPDGLAYECKTCAVKRAKEWAKNNPERVRKNQKNWNERNPGVSAARSKKWREENPERHKASLRKWRRENAEKCKNYNREWYQNNREQHYQNGLRWYRNNIEKARASSRRAARKYKARNPEKIKQWNNNNRELLRSYCQQYRARKKNLPNTLTAKQWSACKVHFNHSCAYCGKQLKRLHQEHFIPASKGGGYTANNIIPACRSCNSSKHNRNFFDWYPSQASYSKLREKRILKYLKCDNAGKQQVSILGFVKERDA